MNTFQMKTIACILMFIDHLGTIIFPKIIIMKVIGRLTFPIFAYLITVGVTHTTNVTKYAMRILIFAFISQIPFMLAFRMSELNIFFTLFLGLEGIIYYNKQDDKRIGLIAVITIAIIAKIVRVDGGAYGVITIFIFYVFKNDFIKLVKYQIILNFSFEILVIFHIAPNFEQLKLSVLLQPMSLLALLIIKQYNNEKGNNFKYIFYMFYPLHLIILGFINTVI